MAAAESLTATFSRCRLGASGLAGGAECALISAGAGRAGAHLNPHRAGTDALTEAGISEGMNMPGASGGSTLSKYQSKLRKC